MKHTEETKARISATLTGTACGGFNVRVNCPHCDADMNPANLSRHAKACLRNIEHAYLFNRKTTTREFKHWVRSIKVTYGITLAQYVALFHQQGGVCSLCQKMDTESGKPLFVDHDHATGKVRGLLCSTCNFGLGYFKDDVSMLERAIEYLKSYKD